jgi:hypothetical protein
MESIKNNVKTGRLAKECCGLTLPLEVLKSNAGFYIGTSDSGYTVSRESHEYFWSHTEAVHALASGEWTQRETP